MSKFLQIVVTLLVFILPGIATAQNPEHRIALVIGNAGYQAGALTTPANDAGLIAQNPGPTLFVKYSPKPSARSNSK